MFGMSGNSTNAKASIMNVDSKMYAKSIGN